MDKIIYDKINEYCNKKLGRVLVQAERDYILRKFLDSYYEAVEKYIEVNNSDPTDEGKRTILNSLLNDSTLLSYSDSAKGYYEEIRRNIENEFQKRQGKPTFLVGVATSIVANLAYSIILLIIFFIAKDQIAVWLIQLGS